MSCDRKVEVAIEETHVPLIRHHNSLTVDKHDFRSIRCFPSIITIGKCHSLVDLLFWNTENIEANVEVMRKISQQSGVNATCVCFTCLN